MILLIQAVDIKKGPSGRYNRRAFFLGAAKGDFFMRCIVRNMS